ncbi:hypothetical protein [Kutzneria sp. 744]|uniref:hypothetical protein n=1 Tax=Kutzneria sp. (strain 744) TaxID=345341 RepID=UPI0003EEC2E3|nr:hypothetical protein [Kutzneria sp. 744]EWM19188.1 hypothetical protein KUTG_09492 [Kutzneria sp. 744]
MSTITSAAHAALTGVLILATAVWLGGFITIAVVARVAQHALGPTERVAFFQALGRAHGIVSGLALLIGFATGAVLVSGRPWDGLLVTTVAVAGLLAATTAIGVAQARRMTRLRRHTLNQTDNLLLARLVRREARGAGLLRAGIGGLSLALVALGVLLAM